MSTRLALLIASLGTCLAGCGDSTSEPDDEGGSGLPPEGVPLGNPWSASYGDPGPLPERVDLKTNTESYNRRYYFGARDGGIWFKPNLEQDGGSGDWEPMSLPPEIAGRISEISADDNEMIGLTVDREIWTMTGALFDPPAFSWKKSWGFPFWTGPGQSLPDLLRWEWSVISPQEDVYWVDPAGNHQPVGQAKVSHIWILPHDQQRLTYIDPWLPLDFSYGMCGPLRDRLRAENLTASGSTVFVINRYGDMFTRLFDFDMSGADGVFFDYSYEDQTGASGLPPIQLPCFDWVQHPKIDGEITNLIGIHKLGEGAVNRTLRVEGVGPSGASGYFEKDVTALDAAAWTFHETGHPLRGIRLENREGDSSSQNLGEPAARRFSRTGDDFSAELDAFNVYCSPTTLTVRVAGESFDLILHTADGVRGEPRAADLDATPRDVTATIEVPPELSADLANREPEVRDFIERYFAAARFTTVGLHATTSELVICPSGPALDRSCAAGAWTFSAEPSAP
jgi:hypothetical protein